MNLHTQSS